ncbi:MAG: DUF2383 domain-containing protein [Myxococcaceae bacterium]|nr:DUF2383 domain-containing protein [Myxococcaceae bacterium]
MAYADTKSNENLDQLNSFLRGEISAVETYRIALEKLAIDSPARARLDACRQSHAERVSTLRAKILALGGTPADGSGAWGTMTKAIEKGASMFGDVSAVDALEAGEDHGLADYRQDLPKLGSEARDLVTTQLLPKQEQTHRTMSELKRELHGESRR